MAEVVLSVLLLWKARHGLMCSSYIADPLLAVMEMEELQGYFFGSAVTQRLWTVISPRGPFGERPMIFEPRWNGSFVGVGIAVISYETCVKRQNENTHVIDH